MVFVSQSGNTSPQDLSLKMRHVINHNKKYIIKKQERL